MFGITLAVVGAFFIEISSSIGKWEIRHRKESVYTMGFTNTLGCIAFYIIFSLIAGHKFHIDARAWPYLIILMILSAMQAWLTVHAIARSERGTFGFIRSGTIPLVLMFDFIFGYRFSWLALCGIVLIFSSLILLYEGKRLSKRGLGWVIGSTINGAIAISLYQFLIKGFSNPVESVQILALTTDAIILFLGATLIAKENPFPLIRKPIIAAQAITQGVASGMFGFAFLFAPASLIVAVERSFSLIWSVLFGSHVFHEKRSWWVYGSIIPICAGIWLLS